MKNISVIFILIIFLQMSFYTYSQENNGVKVGVGISIDPNTIGHPSYINNFPQIYFQQTVYDPILFYIPIKLARNIGIEPVFGLNSFVEKNTTNYPITNGSNNSITTYNLNTMIIGIRVYYYKSLLKMFGIYVGPKLVLNYQSITQENGSMNNYAGQAVYQNSKINIKETDIILGMILGCEYFPISHFSIGGEVSFNYTSYGNPVTTYEYIPPEQNNSSIVVEREFYSFNTDGLVFIRWYLL